MKTKKLQPGMTLIEVVVSMSIFTFMTLAITMAFAGAMKYNARNVKRDKELNLQQSALERGTEGGVLVNNDSFNTKKTITFTDASGTAFSFTNTTSAFTGVTEYYAKRSAYNGEQTNPINFELKTFSSNLFGSNATIAEKSSNHYVMKVNNTCADLIDIRISLSNGCTAYIGDFNNNCYTHKSSLYAISLPAYDPDAEFQVDDDADVDATEDTVSAIPSSMTLGLYMPPTDPSALPYIKIDILKNGSVKYSATVPYSVFSGSSTGVVNMTYNAAGTLIIS